MEVREASRSPPSRPSSAASRAPPARSTAASVKLKKMADDMQDKLEELPQITRVDIVGAPEREFQINVDNFKMQASNITFDDIANAVSRENADISGGLLEVGNMKRTLQVKGQFKSVADINQIIVRNTSSQPIYLKDIATIRDTVKETESYARLNGKNVITLNIIKRSGENLPGRPEDAGIICDLVRAAAGTVPVLGVCLGHQAIGHVYGGDVVGAPQLMHGKTSFVRHRGVGVFTGLPEPLEATRYHSLVIDRATMPDVLEITAETDDGTVMGVRHRQLDVEGVQFHPESILTVAGHDLLKNFLARL